MKFWRAVLQLSTLLALFSINLFAANIGTVVPVLGQVADLVHDASRNLVYLANTSRNQIEIYSVSTARLTGTILTGLQPASLAISPDGNTLYSANVGSFTISVINLNTQRVDVDFFVGSRPDAIAVGRDGKIVILGTAGLLRMDPVTGQLSPVPISPPATPPVGLPVTPTSPTPGGFLAGLVTAANGNLMIGLSTNRLFVYEVASGLVLRSRNVTGFRAILSAAPDGSRFMAGPFLFDTQTLAILGRTGTVSPLLTGGSAFSVDGNDVYATFSTQAAINPLNTNQVPTNVIQILRSSSLTPELGLRIAEPIISKMITSADGANLFANSSSGLMVIPIGQLGNLPTLEVSASSVVLSVDMCNRTIATATVQIRNSGGGRMTFVASVNNPGAPVILNQRTGVAPASFTISFDPRTVATRGTLQYVVLLTSPEAVNVEPAILVNLNFRDVTDRGTIVPLNGVAVDMQMDTARQRLYLANYTQDQIEVFSLASQTFLPPIRVGNRPISMAMVNSSTLVVANSGAENLSVVDLDLMQEVDQIGMGPIPLNANALFPRSVAASSNAVLFTAVPLPAVAGLPPGNGSLWQLSLITHSAFPRLNLGIGTNNVVNGRNLLVAPPDGSSVIVVEGTGTLRLYDPIADTIAVTRTLAVPLPLRGTASVANDGSSFVIDNTVFNSVLVPQGALAIGGIGPAAATALAFGVNVSGNTVLRVQAATAQTPVQSLQRFNLATLQQNLQVLLPEPIMDITPAAIGLGLTTRQWPPRATALEIGINGQTQLLPRGIVTDTSNNAYALTVSGMTIVSLASATGQTPTFTATGVVNRASGSRLVSPGSLVVIRGTNLALADQAGTIPLPRSLGGICVTANEIAIPLISTSSTQIEAQLPTELLPGRVTFTVRSTRLGVSSSGVLVQVNATGPGVFTMDIGDGAPRASLFHTVDGALVIPDYPAERDEIVTMYVTGLGAVDPVVPSGTVNPADPLSPTTETVSVTVGGVPYPVVWSGLAPGFIGIYQIDLYVPGDRARGLDLPIVVSAGSVSSGSATNVATPVTSVQ